MARLSKALHRTPRVTAAPNPGSRPCVCPTITRTAVPSAVAGAFPSKPAQATTTKPAPTRYFGGPPPASRPPAQGHLASHRRCHLRTRHAHQHATLGQATQPWNSQRDAAIHSRSSPSPLCLVAPTSASLGRSPTRERFTRGHFPLVRPPASTCSAAAKSRPQQKNNLNAPLRRISQSSSRLELRALVSPLLRHRRRPLPTGPSPRRRRDDRSPTTPDECGQWEKVPRRPLNTVAHHPRASPPHPARLYDVHPAADSACH
ncbi:hypothetical protein ACCO45_000853 [Purpureocillium lilacinum]|uniref:Uncharacterized protein n=1 Tax=Purpureocillium lilacinum TaxID=33203 RepID=A0ACC4E6S8_PURLI